MIATVSRLGFPAAATAAVGLAWVILAVSDIWHDGVAADAGDPLAAAATFLVGWVVMVVAMMAPTTAPLVMMFRRLVARRRDAAVLQSILLGGYVVAWTGFAVAAFAADRAADAFAARSAWLTVNPWATGSAGLALAGLYQFTPLKHACLDRCRTPFSFVVRHWRGGSGRLDSLLLGLHHGVFCVGCCWALMLLMVFMSAHSLALMLLLAVVMAAEKNLPEGHRLAAPIGIVCLAAAASTAILGLSGEAALANTLCLTEAGAAP